LKVYLHPFVLFKTIAIISFVKIIFGTIDPCKYYFSCPEYVINDMERIISRLKTMDNLGVSSSLMAVILFKYKDKKFIKGVTLK